MANSIVFKTFVVFLTIGIIMSTFSDHQALGCLSEERARVIIRNLLAKYPELRSRFQTTASPNSNSNTNTNTNTDANTNTNTDTNTNSNTNTNTDANTNTNTDTNDQTRT